MELNNLRGDCRIANMSFDSSIAKTKKVNTITPQETRVLKVEKGGSPSRVLAYTLLAKVEL